MLEVCETHVESCGIHVESCGIHGVMCGTEPFHMDSTGMWRQDKVLLKCDMALFSHHPPLTSPHHPFNTTTPLPRLNTRQMGLFHHHDPLLAPPRPLSRSNVRWVGSFWP